MTMTVVEGRVVPLGLANVDTDQIIDSEWLKAISKVGFAAGAFDALRESGVAVCDDPRWKGADLPDRRA